jgi:hypothetical protein
MKKLLTLFLILTASAIAGEHHVDDDDFIGWDQMFHTNAFHRGLEDRPELYLVCIHGFKVQSHGSVPEWEELALRSTIVDAVRGGKKVGDLLEYRHYLDVKAVNPEQMVGTLWYIFVSEDLDDDGKKVRFVDPQDPSCRVRYTEDLAKIVAEHRAYKKQPAPASPAPGKETAAPDTKAAPAPAK